MRGLALRCICLDAMLRGAAMLQSMPEQEGGWVDRLVEFYEGVLTSGEVLLPSGGLAQGMRQPSLSTDVYANVLTGPPLLPSFLPLASALLLGSRTVPCTAYQRCLSVPSRLGQAKLVLDC